MRFFNNIGKLLDEFDGEAKEGAAETKDGVERSSVAEAPAPSSFASAESVAHDRPHGTATPSAGAAGFMGGNIGGLISSAAAAAGSAASAVKIGSLLDEIDGDSPLDETEAAAHKRVEPDSAQPIEDAAASTAAASTAGAASRMGRGLGGLLSSAAAAASSAAAVASMEGLLGDVDQEQRPRSPEAPAHRDLTPEPVQPEDGAAASTVGAASRMGRGLGDLISSAAAAASSAAAAASADGFLGDAGEEHRQAPEPVPENVSEVAALGSREGTKPDGRAAPQASQPPLGEAERTQGQSSPLQATTGTKGDLQEEGPPGGSKESALSESVTMVDSISEGWNIEDRPETVSSTQEEEPSPAAGITAAPSSEFIVRGEDAPAQGQTPSRMLVPDDLIARDPETSLLDIASTVSTSHAATSTSDEYTHCEEAINRTEVLQSMCSVGGGNTSSEPPASPSQLADGDSTHGNVQSPESSADFSSMTKELAALRQQLIEKEQRATKAESEAQEAQERCAAEQAAAAAVEQAVMERVVQAEKEVEVTRQRAATECAAMAEKERAAVERASKAEDDAKAVHERAAKDCEAIAAAERSAVERATRAESSAQALQQQVEELLREVALSKEKADGAMKHARNEADRQRDATLAEVREEMEQELAGMLKKKDNQIADLEKKLAASEKKFREQTRDIERQREDFETLRLESDRLAKRGQAEQAEKEQRAEEVEQVRGEQERMRHELALSLRTVEERARGEIAQLEAQRAQLELQQQALQAQVQQEQQKCDELSVSLGEAQHKIAQLEQGESGAAPSAESEVEIRLAAAESEAQDLRDRLRQAEDKLLQSQSMRDMFAKETDMYRTEIIIARDERTRAEQELAKVQESAKKLQDAKCNAMDGSAQETVVKTMQRDFEERTERFRDEVKYLRQKCDEKDKRCEQLLAEKSSLAAELRAAGRGSAGTGQLGDVDLEAGGRSKRGGGSSSSVRTLALSAPAWLRSADEPLRMVIKTLSSYPVARIVFFAYVLLLHAWCLFILQSEVVH